MSRICRSRTILDSLITSSTCQRKLMSYWKLAYFEGCCASDRSSLANSNWCSRKHIWDGLWPETLEQQQTFSICCFSADAQFRDRAIEEVDQSPRMAKEEEVCKTHFLQTHQQNESGRFTVSFPFQDYPDELGESRNHALRWLYKLEQRFKDDFKLKEEYITFYGRIY